MTTTPIPNDPHDFHRWILVASLEELIDYDGSDSLTSTQQSLLTRRINFLKSRRYPDTLTHPPHYEATTLKMITINPAIIEDPQ